MISPTADIPLLGLPVAVLDFETTGIDPLSCHPVQAAVTHTLLEPEATPEVVFSSLIRPPVAIPSESSSIHGITDQAVLHAPTMEEVLPDLLHALDGRVLCAYNLLYDWTILQRWHPELPLGLDPLVWVRVVDKWVKGQGRHQLGQVCARRGIEIQAHDAAGDTLATAQLLVPLLDQLADQGGWWHRRTLSGLWSWQLKHAVAQENALALYLRKFGREIDRRWARLSELRGQP